MFNLFPKFGSPGDCASTDDLTGKPATNWFYTSLPTFTVDDKTYTADEFIKHYKELYTENENNKALLKSIEEDGTEEHNAAVELRQENAQLKVKIDQYKGIFRMERSANSQIEELKSEVERLKKFEDWHQPELCSEKISELTKEVKNLRHLKKENVELMERVNEIDSDVNRDLQDQLFTLKNDYAVLKSRNTEILEKYNGFVTMGGLKYMEAKLQIVQNNYNTCAKERDEFKHQLNAANKEIEELKKRIDGLSLAIDRKNFEVDEYKTSFERMKRACEQEAKSANSELVKRIELEREVEKLKKDIIDYVYEKDEQKHPMYPIHWGGWDKVETHIIKTDEVSSDLEARVKKLESKVEGWLCPCNMCKKERGE